MPARNRPQLPHDCTGLPFAGTFCKGAVQALPLSQASNLQYIMDEVKELQERIRTLQRQRSVELEILRRMTLCPRRKNSYGKYEHFKKGEQSVSCAV